MMGVGNGNGQTQRELAVVQEQLRTLLHDFGQMGKRMDAHDRLHEQEARDRVSGRRWMAGFALTVLTLLVAIVALVLTQLAHGH